MTTTAQTPESVTGTTGADAYQSLKSGSTAAQSQTADEAVQTSESEESTDNGKKVLTDADKAERKRANDERRQKRWYEERGEMRAEMRQLKEQLERVGSQSNRNETASTAGDKPTLKSFLDSGKFKTYEEAHEAFTEALTDYKVQREEANRSAAEVQAQVESDRRNFQAQLKAGHKEYGEAFQDALDLVQQTVDGPKGEATPLSNFIVRAKDAAALINYFGENADVLESLTELDYEDAIAEIGVIRKDIKAQAKTPLTETTVPPKPPKRASGAGDVPDHRTAMKQAADKNDFSAWQKSYRASKQKKA